MAFKILARISIPILVICVVATGCASHSSTSTLLPPQETTTPTQPPISTPTIQKLSIPESWSISDVVTTSELADLTGYADYQYLLPEYDDPEGGEPAGIFWNVFTATVQIEFRAHRYGGLEKLEDYRTAAVPGSLVWLESPLWDTGCFYWLDEWTAEIVAVRKDACYFISFVPSAYPDFTAVDLAEKLMRMFIQNQDVNIGRNQE